MQYSPPYCVITILANFTSGRVTHTGCSSLFSYIHISTAPYSNYNSQGQGPLAHCQHSRDVPPNPKFKSGPYSDSYLSFNFLRASTAQLKSFNASWSLGWVSRYRLSSIATNSISCIFVRSIACFSDFTNHTPPRSFILVSCRRPKALEIEYPS